MQFATMTNRIDHLFQEKKGNILSVYFTSGFPNLHDTVPIMESLQEAGADMIEVGITFSDPIADGPTIQESNYKALLNGMTLELLMQQLQGIREKIHIPILLMGYLNPIIQYGIRKFCSDCKDRGIDGLILPDLPMQEYLDIYKPIFDEFGLYNIYLVSPQTSEERIRVIDQNTKGFIYLVSSAGTTGAKNDISEEQEAYFKRIQNMNLQNPTLIGFGISNHDTFSKACRFASGAIIGSAFIRLLSSSRNIKESIHQFIKELKGKGN
jgi:tryptophan synthase alpha chain